MITRAQTEALATFVSRIRPDWDHPGIVAAITKAGQLGTPAEIGTALCRLAGNVELRTPAILAGPGPHWHDTSVAARVWPDMCPTHPHVPLYRCEDYGPCAQAATAPPTGWRDDVKLKRRPRAIHPEPKPTDLDPLRDRMDAEAAS